MNEIAHFCGKVLTVHLFITWSTLLSF